MLRVTWGGTLRARSNTPSGATRAVRPEISPAYASARSNEKEAHALGAEQRAATIGELAGARREGRIDGPRGEAVDERLRGRLGQGWSSHLPGEAVAARSSLRATWSLNRSPPRGHHLRAGEVRDAHDLEVGPVEEPHRLESDAAQRDEVRDVEIGRRSPDPRSKARRPLRSCPRASCRMLSSAPSVTITSASSPRRRRSSA